MGMPTIATASTRLPGEIAITSRPLSTYREMFLLTDDELATGPILDCPAGASPFGAQVRARGGAVVSVDPAYTVPFPEISARFGRDLNRQAAWWAARPENFDWSYCGSPAALVRIFEVSFDLFAADFAADDERYVAAALPRLPFPDGHFALALSGFLLFTYSGQVGFDDHVAYLLELVRVTRGEVRVCPLVDSGNGSFPRLAELRAVLAEHGVRTEIRAAASSHHLGGDRILACQRGPR